MPVSLCTKDSPKVVLPGLAPTRPNFSWLRLCMISPAVTVPANFEYSLIASLPEPIVFANLSASSCALSNSILSFTIVPTAASITTVSAPVTLPSIGKIIERPIKGIINFCIISPTAPGIIDPTIATPDAAIAAPPNPIPGFAVPAAFASAFF